MISLSTISLAHTCMLFILPTHSQTFSAFSCSVIPCACFICSMILSNRSEPVLLCQPDNCSACHSLANQDIHSCGIPSNTANVFVPIHQQISFLSLPARQYLINKDDKKPLAMSYYPQLRAFYNMDSFRAKRMLRIYVLSACTHKHIFAYIHLVDTPQRGNMKYFRVWL